MQRRGRDDERELHAARDRLVDHDLVVRDVDVEVDALDEAVDLRAGVDDDRDEVAGQERVVRLEVGHVRARRAAEAWTAKAFVGAA